MDTGLSVDQKVEMYIDFINKDFPDLGIAYRNIDFLFDLKRNNMLYIYNHIYEPIINLKNSIRMYYWNFVWHENGTGRNEQAMSKYIEEIEGLIFEKMQSNINDEIEIGIYSIYNKFARTIRNELNGKYYKLMYGNKNIDGQNQ